MTRTAILDSATNATPTNAMSYNLIDCPWILVQGFDGRVEELSILEALARAGRVKAVVGEVPTQVFAIVRLLLAVLHRAVDGPPDEAAWRELWRADRLPVGRLESYADTWRGRFDLLDPVTPFYQVADLRTARGEVFSLDRLLGDVPTGERYFSMRQGAGIERIGWAEAARWLVHCQAFDPSGIKSGAVGDPRVKGGKGYPIGTGWAGALGGVLAEGDSLKETLLLNLIPDDFDAVDIGEDDVPVWERRPQSACEEVVGGREPAGPLDLYTWQSRRVRLFADTNGVYGAVVANGDRIAPQNRHRREPMSAWRRSPAQEKKLRQPQVYMPRQHEPERAVWRGLGALLPRLATDTQRGEAAASLAPAVLKWVARLRLDQVLSEGYRVRARAIGMQYGSQQSTTTEVMDDAVVLPVVVLADADGVLGAMAVSAVSDAEQGAQAVGTLGAMLAEAAGGDGAGARDRARESAWALLDGPFRSWLAGIDPAGDPEGMRGGWQRTATRALRTLGADLVGQAGPAAWVGRQNGNRHVSTAEADLWFRRKLRSIFVLAYRDETSEATT